MKVELTQRDKKLLTFLGVFVIVVCIGYWGILPQIKGAQEYKDDIEEQRTLRDVYDQKIALLVGVQANNDELEDLISGAKENYYPVMDSDAIDKLITNTVINNYKLMAYDLIIGERNIAELGPYIYSKKSLTGKSDAKQKALSSAAPVIGEDGMTLFSDVAAADAGTVGIYKVAVSMRLSGDKLNISKLLDDLALTKKKLRLVNYSTETEETIIPHNDGNDEILVNNILNLTVELYMCAD